MRCEARLLCAGSRESAARAAPVGGPAVERAWETPKNAAAASAAAARIALAKRLTVGLAEEVQVLRVDGHADLVAELQVDVRRERGDEIRARAHDGLLALARELLLLGRLLRLDVARVDMEVGHRLAAERLDQIDPSVDLRQVVPPLRRMEVAGAQAHDHVAAVVLAEPGIAAERLVGDRELVAAEVYLDAAVDARRPLEQVHRRRADEARDEEVVG